MSTTKIPKHRKRELAKGYQEMAKDHNSRPEPWLDSGLAETLKEIDKIPRQN